MSSGNEVTYPPLDVAKPVAAGVWIVDSGPMRVLGMPMPVRMTVIRLRSGDLLLHSPTRFDEDLKRQLQREGPIRHLVAPNTAHWSFLADWQRACPDSLTWAAPGLRDRAQVRKSPLRIERELAEAAPPDWTDDIEQVSVPGGGGFTEIAFFHRPSSTLVLTDLVVNLEPAKMPAWMRPGAHLVGATAPVGRAPVYLRLLIRMKRAEAANGARRLLDLGPERVIFAHGKWFDQDATASLRRSLAWLVA